MQIDMHYYGTYSMARAAGLSREAAGIIATAAQYVDDNVQTEPVALKDGARLARTPTAHHLSDLPRNVEPDDQRNVWVPFHFLPGGEASAGGDADYSERIKCRKDSEPAREMVEMVVMRAALDPHALERLGVTAHVYADTFSHFGFSGVSSRRNSVKSGSFRFVGIEPDLAEHLKGKAKAFFERYSAETKFLANVKSWVAETATNSLGHGAVATYPDLPYLSWGFDYEFPTKIADDRSNSDSFLEACQALYDMFVRVADKRPDFIEGKARSFDQIKDTIIAILAVKGGSADRSNAWKQAALAGKLFAQAEPIPDYQGEVWTKWLEDANKQVDSETALNHPSCRFHLAANAHRSWVLHELMPSRNLLIA
ncbi:MAG: hypothetical protein H7Y60_14775 [Rhodospirillaceae bacterium]|nr:hypothetical protein [Rhodospirillales bacterium]